VTETEDMAPFVLALTIVKSSARQPAGFSADDQILICVRNKDINRTHPEVVSVPTQRIPKTLAENLLQDSQTTGMEGDTNLFQGEVYSNTTANGHNEVVFLVESLLSKKLGVADSLESGLIKFRAALHGNQNGVAKYPNLDETEHLQMINIVVYVEEGAQLFPTETKSYDLVKWVPTDGFLKMWFDGKDPTNIGLTGEQALGVCVDGLCIASTADIIAAQMQS